MTKERVLDVSELEPPEPFRMALAAIDALEEGEFLRMCHRREPFPLYQTLDRMGFSYRVRAGARTRYEILIWPSADVELTAHCGPASTPGDRAGPERGPR
ncbi:MAG: DUF2249 domain-containing protein [bacterium]|nr:DUF2249 domain-containing protein [bacterium]MCP5067506.1 DUF2249 domain-containing protein [bacterium]